MQTGLVRTAIKPKTFSVFLCSFLMLFISQYSEENNFASGEVKFYNLENKKNREV